jgi:hypothetical protein
MTAGTQPKWSRSMRSFLWTSNLLFGVVSLASVIFAVMTWKTSGRVDYRALGAALFGIGVITWSVSILKHPDEWRADRKALQGRKT